MECRYLKLFMKLSAEVVEWWLLPVVRSKSGLANKFSACFHAEVSAANSSCLATKREKVRILTDLLAAGHQQFI